MKVQYAAKLDCVKEGCSPKHEDHGEIFGPYEYASSERIVRDDVAKGINGHAATLVFRTISDWEEVDPKELGGTKNVG